MADFVGLRGRRAAWGPGDTLFQMLHQSFVLLKLLRMVFMSKVETLGVIPVLGFWLSQFWDKRKGLVRRIIVRESYRTD